MTKHDRLLKALQEIKDYCVSKEDYDLGCSPKCMFLKAPLENGYRGCQIMDFVQPHHNEIIDTPSEWGERDELQDELDELLEQCYECGGLGDDYYTDDNGELVLSCGGCSIRDRLDNLMRYKNE